MVLVLMYFSLPPLLLLFFVIASSKSVLNFSIKAAFSVLAADIKSAWFNDTSAPGIGT